jgi:galactose-1-phosphate uridylyltransferase
MGPFYPKGMHSEAFLPYYAGRFSTVEINAQRHQNRLGMSDNHNLQMAEMCNPRPEFLEI